MGIYEKLLNIQTELKAPKSQYNSFGKYYYRSCEDILEAAKPICKQYGAALTVSDEIVLIGERFYLKATATLTDIESGEKVSTTAFAREALDKKGMDESQVTGTASSYSRKYCLNGLFCIDDTKDADALKPPQGEQAKETTNGKVTAQQIADLQALAKQKGVNIESIVNGYKLKTLQDISPQQWAQAMNGLQKRADVS